MKGILFDFDGVLAKSVDDHANAWVKALAEFGVEISANDWYPLEGVKTTKIAELLWEKGGGKGECDPEAIFAKKEKFYRKDHSFAFYPGVEEFIAELAKNRVPIGIVTSSVKSNLEVTVPRDFLQFFNIIVSGDMVKYGKPSPDCYLMGAKELAIETGDCVVLENAPKGIEAAKAAGCFCVGVCTTNTEEVLRNADLVVPSLAEFCKLSIIRELIERYRDFDEGLKKSK